MKYVLEAESINKTFGDIRALFNVTFSVYYREIFALLGPNGAGKTTLMEILSLTLKPDSGKLKILGYDALHKSEQIRRYISIIRQQPGFDFFVSGIRNLKIFAKLYGIKLNTEWTNRLLDLFELREHLCRKVMLYSGGMMKKLAIVRSLMVRPRVLLMDEPTAGLDMKSSEVFWSIIKTLREQGTTIVFATHRINEAELFADRVAIMHHGQIIMLGKPNELKQKVPGRCVIRMEVANYYDNLRDYLLGLSGVEEVIVMKSVANRSILRIYCADDSILVDIIKAISHKSRVLSVNVREKSLEDVYVFYTGGEWS